MNNNIKVIAFDLDGTLTQHRTELGPENRAVLDRLAERYTLIMAGAGQCERIFRQMGRYPLNIIGNYGLQYAEYHDGAITLVRDDILPVDREDIERKVTMLRERYGFTSFTGDNVEFHPSGCLTFPILGTKAKTEDKLRFDPDRTKRRAIYGEVSATFPEYNVFVGGSSSFDMVPKPYNKYHALDRYCLENGLSHAELAFAGDDFGLGGNDESVYKSDFTFIEVDTYTRFGECLKNYL